MAVDNVVPFPQDSQPLKARPFEWIDPSKIPRREFLFGRHYIRKFVSATIAPGATGKSSVVLAEAMSMASGRKLMHLQPDERCKVWYWNGEDPYDELQRRVMAAALAYVLDADDLAGHFWVNSGRDNPLKVAIEQHGGHTVMAPQFQLLEEEIRANGIDCVIFDPFISTHSIGENENSAINDIVKAFAALADRCNIAVELVHHVRKSRDDVEVAAEDARGASAFVDACRSVRTLTRMPKDLAEGWGVDDKMRKTISYATLGKANLGPPLDPFWYRIMGQGLGNPGPDPAKKPEDNIGVAVMWTPPKQAPTATVARVIELQDLMKEDPYRYDARSEQWIGHIVGQVFQIDSRDAKKRKAIIELIEGWLSTGILKKDRARDDKYVWREYVRVGHLMRDVQDEAKRSSASI